MRRQIRQILAPRSHAPVGELQGGDSRVRGLAHPWPRWHGPWTTPNSPVTQGSTPDILTDAQLGSVGAALELGDMLATTGW